jgi:hypothetical protein
MASHDQAAPSSRDFLARPLSAVLWWGLPLTAGWLAGFLPIAETATTLVWTAGLAWMGAGCALNARRCHRLHCYVSAPVLFLGAIGTLATALGFAPFGPHTGSYVINTTLVLALSTFVVEPVWGKYRSR